MNMYITPYKRLIEIDFLKGIAVVCMVIFHVFYMINEMNISQYYSSSKGIIRLLAEISHNLFIFMVGVNLVISYQNYAKNDKKKYQEYIYKQTYRAIKIFLAGLLINIITYLLFPKKYVIFGIFSFISCAILLTQPFIFYEMRYITLLIGLIIIYVCTLLNSSINSVTDQYIYNNCMKYPLTCFITGIKNVKYNSLDYFPLIPNMGIIFLGVFTAHIIYDKGLRIYKEMDIIDEMHNNSLINITSILGKYSFEIYFIHFFLIYIILLFYKRQT